MSGIDKKLEVVFLGVGGSCPFNNGNRTFFGTNTACVLVKGGEQTVVFDAGSGIAAFDRYSNSADTHLFLSHYHEDHLCGLIFWKQLFDRGSRVNIYGMGNVKHSLENFLHPQNSPVGTDDFSAEIVYNNVQNGSIFPISRNFMVSALLLSHPGGCMGYRVDYYDKSVVFLTDIELADYEDFDVLADFAKEADLIIADSAYPVGKSIKGWGHSTPSECALLSRKSGAKSLALFHYSHLSTDDDIKELEKAARTEFRNSVSSYEGLILKV